MENDGLEMYRPCHLGKALADVLEEMIQDGKIDESAGSKMFQLFDAEMHKMCQESTDPVLQTSIKIDAEMDNYHNYIDNWQFQLKNVRYEMDGKRQTYGHGHGVLHKLVEKSAIDKHARKE